MAGKDMGKAKTNQDSLFVHTDIGKDGSTALLGVFDGHGLEGHKVSNFLVSQLHGSSSLTQIYSLCAER